MAEPTHQPTSSPEKAQASPAPSHPLHHFSGNPTAGAGSAWKTSKYPNQPDPFNPDPITLRDQWRFAIRQYSRWYSQAWGAAILAGASFFALGWYIKGYNPLSSAHEHQSLDTGAADMENRR